MKNNEYSENLLRLIASCVYSSLFLQASREMFGRSWYSLGAAEQQAIIQAVTAQVGYNMNFLTLEVLKKTLGQKDLKSPAGFQPQTDMGLKSQKDTSQSQPPASQEKK